MAMFFSDNELKCPVCGSTVFNKIEQVQLLKYKDSAAVVESRVRFASECSSCHKIRPCIEYDSPMS